MITPGILRVGAHLVELRHAPFIRQPHGRVAGRFDGDYEPVASRSREADALARVLGGYDHAVAAAAVIAVAAEGFDYGVDAVEAFAACYAVLERGGGCCEAYEGEEEEDGEVGEGLHGWLWLWSMVGAAMGGMKVRDSGGK